MKLTGWLATIGLTSILALASSPPATYKSRASLSSEEQEYNSWLGRISQIYREKVTHSKIVPAIPQAYKQQIETMKQNLKTRQGYMILETATWCSPCQALEKRLKATGLYQNIDAIAQPSGTWDIQAREIAFLRMRFAQEKVYVPSGIPFLLKNEEGRVVKYSDFNLDDMFGKTEEGVQKPIAKIFTKQK